MKQPAAMAATLIDEVMIGLPGLFFAGAQNQGHVARAWALRVAKIIRHFELLQPDSTTHCGETGDTCKDDQAERMPRQTLVLGRVDRPPF
jgi:hypothetical protein